MREAYYARSPNKFGERELVSHHLARVSELCAGFLTGIGCADAGAALGLLHDLGKYSEKFAQVLEHRREHVNHAFPGGAAILRCYGEKKGTPRMLAMVAAAHHSRLGVGSVDLLKSILNGSGGPLDPDGNELSLFGREEIEGAVRLLGKELPLPGTYPVLPDWHGGEDENLSYMLCARMLLSALADADYSASAEHFDADYLKERTGPELKAGQALGLLFALREEKRRGSRADPGLNRLRDELFESCLRAAEVPPGLFTLTAPTGLGKTLALFAFAARHCEIHKKRRIILLLPYLALAEQNITDYRAVVPELLESHSAAELSEETRLLAERWSAPLVVTTTVGFFEPLFSDRPTDCRRLHQVAGSVIVLDEAQSLPHHLLDATLRTVKELCERYGCTVLFSTATQPSYGHRPGLAWTPREIVPEPQRLFSATRRVRVEWRIESPTSMETLAAELAEEPVCCAIVNLRRHADLLFKLLQERCGADGVFLLTTDLCLAHRRAVLKEIKGRIAAGLSCRLVATQCIEAGVDLDFPVLYRALAPLESIIQAAGRCNRNGSGPDGRVVVFVPDLPGRLYPDDHYGYAAGCVRTLLARHPVDVTDLSHIDEYYAILYPYSSGDKAELRDAILNRNFEEVCKQYRLIKQRGVSIVVPYGPERELYERVRDESEAAGISRGLMREARPIVVSSFLSPELSRVCVPLSVRLPGGKTAGRDTGWYLLGNEKFYDAHRGLCAPESDIFTQ